MTGRDAGHDQRQGAAALQDGGLQTTGRDAVMTTAGDGGATGDCFALPVPSAASNEMTTV
jgi:hypothetical protein